MHMILLQQVAMASYHKKVVVVMDAVAMVMVEVAMMVLVEMDMHNR